ncbi:MAG TPA: UvrD-helicase domain-containing protein [Salinimicrobium sp.]|nr:UvrD-helicase domain-containing protein [Salinimicrobium sp.]
MSISNSYTIYNASAGSGKTYTLVKEYLLLLFQSEKIDSYKNILAVTFTNKAVAEMKSRIVNTLFDFSEENISKKNKNLRAEIALGTGKTEEELRIRSKDILKHIIHNYASFEVSTIDGFTHRVLRTFAKDLGLPLNFEVELNTGEVLQEAVDRVINKAGKDKQLTRVLINFAVGKADDDKSWDISRDLYKIGELLTVETHQPYLELLKDKTLTDFEQLAEKLKQQNAIFEEGVVATAEKFFDLLHNNGIEHEDFSGKYCPNFFQKILKKDFNVGFMAAWQQKLANEPLYPKRVNSDKKIILDRLQPEIAEIYQEAKRQITTLEFIKAIKKNLTPLSLLSAIQDEIEIIKKERSIVLISDFNATIGRSVKDQPAPFIYERLGERYQHYFIDEFQDTSQLQWENLIPLIGHALSTGYPSPERASLTLVGDAKQSIYRWRGGKAEQFMQLCSKENPFNLENKQVLLPDNYRSAREIVDFNNAFFKFSAQYLNSPEHKELFENSGQNAIFEDGGYVNISFIEAENAQEEMEKYPQEVLKIIRDLESRNISKSNICILTRTGKEGIAIANYLSENEVPIISFQSLLVARSAEVNFLIEILQFVAHGKDRHLKLQILEYLLEHQLQVGNEFQFISDRIDLEEQAFFDSLNNFDFHFELNKITTHSLYEAMEYCIRSFKLAPQPDAYLQFFLDFVHEATQQGNSGIFEFLELWERKKDSLSIVAPESEDAVQIMTIHKAKGLEFPIVIYPFANGKILDVSRESLWMKLPEAFAGEIPVGYLAVSEKMQHWNEEACNLYNELCSYSQFDALNVLYVAMTRPAQQLYVISKMNSGKKKEVKRVSDLFIAFLESTGKWDGNQEYEFGTKENFIQKQELSLNSLEQKTFYSSSTEGRGLSIVTRSGLLWDSAAEMAIEKGHLIHEIFSRINAVSDVEQVLRNAIEDGLFKKEEEQEIKKSIYKVISHPQLEEYYTGNSTNLNEQDIISANGNVIRPDRLNIINNQVSIIDYKTGDAYSAHENQINAYAEVLSEMGYTIIRKLLVYINEEISVNQI